MAETPVTLPNRPRLLVVDDEPDVLSVTELSLRGLRHRGQRLEVLYAPTGREAVQAMRADPQIGVILLDVVMETDSAGLDACRAIREELGNPFVRILLRTGQPGSAPERETIDSYDIDGYLPKAELTSIRLYTAVRTAFKAWEELVDLERHRRSLAAVHDCVVSMRSFEPLQDTLNRVLQAAVSICPTPLAVLHLDTFDGEGDAQRYTLHLSAGQDLIRAEATAGEVAARINRDPDARSRVHPGPFEGGYLVPIALHREVGHGFLYLAEARPDALAEQALGLLASHTRNALYSSVALTMLSKRDRPLFEEMVI